MLPDTDVCLPQGLRCNSRRHLCIKKSAAGAVAALHDICCCWWFAWHDGTLEAQASPGCRRIRSGLISCAARHH